MMATSIQPGGDEGTTLGNKELVQARRTIPTRSKISP
jgi:hypothetical protein